MLNNIADLCFQITKSSHKIHYGNVKGLESGFRNFTHLIVSNNDTFHWAIELYSGTYLSDEFDHCLEQLGRQIEKQLDVDEAIEKLKQLHIPFTTPYRSIQNVIDAVITSLVIYKIFIRGNLNFYLKPIPLSRCYASGGTTPQNISEIENEITLTNNKNIKAYKFRASPSDIDRITSVADLVSKDFSLMVDFIGGTRDNGNFEGIVQNLTEIDKVSEITWFEEPFAAFEFIKYRDLKSLIKNAGICGGESLPSIQMLTLFDAMDSCDYLQLDACFNINLLNAQNSKFNTNQVIHNWSGPFGTLTNIILFHILDASWFEVPLPEYDFTSCFKTTINNFDLISDPMHFYENGDPQQLWSHYYSESYDFKWRM